MQPKKERITNHHYKKFLQEGLINTINEEELAQALKNITGRYGKHITEARALLITLYYTGARPNEILRLKGKDFKKTGRYISVIVPASKNGLPRTLMLPHKHELVKELYDYTSTMFPEVYLFYNFHSTAKHEVKNPDGTIKKVYPQLSAKLYYHFLKWFDGVLEFESISPYYLRHNRFSKLAIAGVDLNDLRMWKGAKTLDSVMPYLHMSTASSKKIAKKLE